MGRSKKYDDRIYAPIEGEAKRLLEELLKDETPQMNTADFIRDAVYRKIGWVKKGRR